MRGATPRSGKPMRKPIRFMLAAAVGLCCVHAVAQLAAEDPDWQEIEAPAAPEFDRKRLVRFEMPIGGALEFGVDPATISIGKDGVVRYVMVASSPNGNLNAMYEAIRCATGEFKTYARRTGDTAWSAQKQPVWQSMQNQLNARHAWHLAKQGVCTGRAPATSVADILRSLKSPPQDNR